jgi:hypothetical protein
MINPEAYDELVRLSRDVGPVRAFLFTMLAGQIAAALKLMPRDDWRTAIWREAINDAVTQIGEREALSKAIRAELHGGELNG